MNIIILVSCENTIREEVKNVDKMEYNYAKLRGKIREVFKTDGAFARAMGFTCPTLSKKLNNTTEWKRAEMHKACVLLGIPLEEVPLYFFSI